MLRLLLDFFRHRFKAGNAAQNIKVLIAVLAIVCYSTSGYLYFEIEGKPDLSWADAVWWSFVTMTTVGYGDYFPVTNWGRFVVGLPTMLFGISILGYLLSSVATFIIEAKSKELKGMNRISEKGHILIVHFHDLNWILQLINELRNDVATKDKPIVLIDNELEELPVELHSLGVRFVKGNPARQTTLEQANIFEATHAIILSRDPKDVRSDDLNLAVAMTIESIHPQVHTVAECVDAESIEVLRRTGCDSVVCAAKFSSSLLVQELLDPGVQDVVEEMTSVSVGQQLFVLPVEDMKEWTFRELRIWLDKNELLLMGIKREGRINLNPRDKFKVKPGDCAVFIGAKRPDSIRTV